MTCHDNAAGVHGDCVVARGNSIGNTMKQPKFVDLAFKHAGAIVCPVECVPGQVPLLRHSLVVACCHAVLRWQCYDNAMSIPWVAMMSHGPRHFYRMPSHIKASPRHSHGRAIYGGMPRRSANKCKAPHTTSSILFLPEFTSKIDWSLEPTNVYIYQVRYI